MNPKNFIHQLTNGLLPAATVFLILISVRVELAPLETASAQALDSFESDETQWELSSKTDPITQRSWQNETTTATSKSGASSALVQFESVGTRRISISRTVDPSYAIPEFVPTVWVKTDGCQVGLSIRVVLPHSKSPNSENPISVFLQGPATTASSDWQKLSFDAIEENVTELLEQKKWLLREKLKDVDIRIENAYVDLLKLEITPGKGLNRLWIDDLNISGKVSAKQIADQVFRNGALVRGNNVRHTSGIQEDSKPKAIATQNGSVIETKSQPFAIRSIEHNGEALQALLQMGFNTIELNQPPTKSQRRDAIRLGMWIICPPPKEVGLYSLDQTYDRVLAWRIGPNLTELDIQETQTLIREIRQSDFRSDRPVMVDALNSWTAYGRMANILGVQSEFIGTSFPVRHYSDWLGLWRKAAGSVPTLCAVETELNLDLMGQVAAITGRTPPTPLSPEQIKYAVYEALAGGARGVRFRSRTRLDSGDPSARLRATTLQWINQHLITLEPWLAGGAVMGKIDTAISGLDVTELKTSKARLLLVQKSTGNEQLFCGDAQVATQTFEDSNSTTTDQAYWISETGLTPRSKDAVGGRMSININETGPCAAFVVTKDPVVVNQLSRSYSPDGGQQNSGLRFQLTQNWLAITQLLDQQNTQAGLANVAVSGQVTQADTLTRQAVAMANNRTQLTAFRFLSQANEQLAFARREMMLSARRGFSSITSSPLTMHCTLLPDHARLVSRISRSSWNPNGLAGGDFENLEHMKNNGWQNISSDDQFVQTQVRMIPEASVRGELGIRLKVWPRSSNDAPSLVESTPLWITSGEVPVKAGQLVRIHGWVNIPRPITGSPDGLLIEDSLSGRALGERIHSTNGWQEFSLYRGVSQDGMMRVKFSMTGIGTAMLDEVTIQTMDLPLPTRNARLNSSGLNGISTGQPPPIRPRFPNR